MFNAIISVVAVLMTLIALVLLLVHAVYQSWPGRVGYIPIPMGVIPEIIKALGLNPNDTLIDLGCGDGRILAAALRLHPKAHGVGVDINPVIYKLASLRLSPVKSRVQLSRGNLLHQDLHTAQRVFTYLSPPTMAALEAKLEQELPSGARLVSCDFPLPTRKADATVALAHRGKLAQNLYVYDY